MTIQEFPLAWRWTQPSHSVLPGEVLARIRPLSPFEAARVRTESTPQASIVVSCSASEATAVRRWLHMVQPDSQLAIYVCWSPDVGVQMTWGIFEEYWDDFCYSSSDDVTIAPVSGTWRLIYHHYEQFDFTTWS